MDLIRAVARLAQGQVSGVNQTRGRNVRQNESSELIAKLSCVAEMCDVPESSGNILKSSSAVLQKKNSRRGAGCLS